VQHDTAPRWAPARLAYGFYTVAATGAVIGQTWVAYIHVPWTDAVPAWARIAAVLPFALCLELLAMALAAMGDQRMRLGEAAWGFRIFSTLIASVAVGILVLGHWPHYYWSGGFGILSTSAYVLWLLHAAARRRDALRAAGKLADTAPDYGLWRRLRYPVWTARAAELARQGHTDPATGTWRPLSLYESLHAAQLAIRADKRRPALARAVEQVVRAAHPDPKMADIAVRTLDLDRIATELEHRVDYPAWADRLAPAITIPATTGQPRAAVRPPGDRDGGPSRHDRTVARRRRVVVRPAQAARIGSTVALFTPATRPAVGAATDTCRLPLAVSRDDATAASTRHRTDPDRVAGRRNGVPRVRTAGTIPAADEDPTTVPVLTAPSEPDHNPATPPPAVAFYPSPLSTEDDAAGDAELRQTAVVLSETAAAVAYWHAHDPNMRNAEIAKRVGCSVRHVRRIRATLDNPDAGEADERAPAVLADARR